MKVATGDPAENGIYACRQYYGWRILEWFDSAWWHVGRSAKWPIAGVGNLGSIEAHCGPLPVIAQDFTAKPIVAMEYDL